jgi:acetyl-CoA carboxylase biotin carboxylase subunit
VLVANRGEIALRVARTCREMGIETVAVFSRVDRASRHAWSADEAYCIGEAASRESYLDIDAIIGVARKAGVDAIHPGYGFLSENARFASRCAAEGIIFIGPSPRTMDAMGDKISARRQMISAGVPVVPGIERGLRDEREVIEACRSIGFPVMLKASMGGGGKGIRLARDEGEARVAYREARSEALSSFGDDTVYAEKFIEEPRHVEFQVLGDAFGHVIHLGDRECSIQRRHQKLLEESPSPYLPPGTRREMGEKAVAAARAVGYTGAGTVEFLVDKRGDFFFLEMNTRLQVEHPVTEAVLGVDLVREQIKIAEGRALTLEQEEMIPRGHAIELRVCAEDAGMDFMPSPGTIKKIIEPGGPGIRVDSHAYEGYEIPVHYDAMISKLVAWAMTREEAIARLHRALHEYKITGVKTNINYLKKIIGAPAFVDGKYDTGFIAANAGELVDATVEDAGEENLALAVAYMDYLVNLEENRPDNKETRPGSRWRNFGLHKGILRI